MTKPRRKKRRGSPRAPNECTPLERVFVDAYVGEAAGNGALAARMAGYSDRADGCKVRAAELLGRPRVQALLEVRRAEVEELDRAATELARSAKLAEVVKNRALLAVGPIGSAADRQRFWSAVYHGEIEGFTGADRIRASELLGKAQGDFNHVRRVQIGLGDVDDDDLWAELVASRKAAGKLIDAEVRAAIEAGDEGVDEGGDDAT